MKVHRILLAGAAACSLGFGSTSAVAQAPANNDQLFVSANNNMEELGEELTRLYLTLFNSGRLSVRKVDIAFVSPFWSIESVFRDLKLFYGKRFPESLDGMACDLNPDVCTRRKKEASLRELGSLTGHVGGFDSSKGEWKVRLGTRLILPAMQFTEQTRWIASHKTKTRTLDDLVVNELGGCVKLDEKCRTAIVRSNRKAGEEVLKIDYEGPLTLPLLRLDARIDVATAQETQKNTIFPPTASVESGGVKLVPVQGSINNQGSYKLEMPKVALPDDLNLVIKELKKSLVGDIKAAPQSDTAPAIAQAGVPAIEPGKQILESAFETHRNVNLAHIGLSPGPKLEFASKATVAIFDNWIDREHCGFERKIPADGANPATIARSQYCDRLVDYSDPDHGTHVAGLIGSRVGVNPLGQLYAFDVDFDKITGDALNRMVRLLAKLRTDYDVDVVNFSFGYPAPPIADPLEKVMWDMRTELLFVAAAGNDALDKSRICDIRPACFNMPNVIAVAALKGDRNKPELHAKSNKGSPIHVAVHGDELFSTLRGGRYGTKDGTSHASPLVAGVAALLLAKNKKLLPIQVKNRLIYCSDHVPELAGQIFGGRLNADCVLDYNEGRLKLTTGPLRGRFDAKGEIKFKRNASGGTVSFKIEHIRGLHFDEKRRRYVVFFNDDPTKLDSTLNRLTGLLLESSPEEQFQFTKAGDNHPTFVSLKDILSYASPEVLSE